MSIVSPPLDDDDDRITNLPLSLKHVILDLLPLHDAARTSTLSKCWSKTWTTRPVLAFDKLFFLQVTSKKNEEAHLSAFSAVVDTILSANTGPIWDIEIYIPLKLDNHHINQWIQQLPKQDLILVKLDNSENDACLIPSDFFDFENLNVLTLIKWILSPPPDSRCFVNLISVELHYVSISARISLGNIVHHLELHHCTGIEHLDITNNKHLRRLVINQSSTINWRWLENATKLGLLLLLLPAADFDKSKSVNLIRLLSNCARIHSIFLSDFTHEILGPDPSMLKTLATKMVSLKNLHLYHLRYNLCRISNSLCLIRNLPNLQKLQVKLGSSPENSTIERHLESLDWKDVVLDQLLSVELSGLVGSRSVFHITRILLASSPSLREMSFFCSTTVSDPNEKLRIKRELLQLPRKSLEAQLHWFD